MNKITLLLITLLLSQPLLAQADGVAAANFALNHIHRPKSASAVRVMLKSYQWGHQTIQLPDKVYRLKNGDYVYCASYVAHIKKMNLTQTISISQSCTSIPSKVGHAIFSDSIILHDGQGNPDHRPHEKSGSTSKPSNAKSNKKHQGS